MTITVVTHEQHRTIDCDAAPLLPNGWSVRPEDQITSAVRGDLIFDTTKITPYFSERQKNGKTIVGHDLRKELEGQPVLNACVLDHLLANTNLIPEAWKVDENGNTLYHFFWGTLYRGSSGLLYIRCLYWSGGGWDWDCIWLDDRFDGQRPAVLAS